MSNQFQCGDNPALAGYLYDECEPAERAAIEAHVSVCAACAAEIAALASTRTHLASWAPPEAELGFQIVRPHPSTGARAARPTALSLFAEAKARNPESNAAARWWSQPIPAWGQMAAAVLIFAAGLSMGVARGYWSDTPTGSVAVAPERSPAVDSTTASADDLASLERRLRAEMAQVRTPSVTSATSSSQPAASDARLIEQVRTLIAESEQRQQRELAVRMTQLAGDFDAQRRLDLARIQQAMGQFEGTAGAELLRQGQAINNFIRVSQQGR